jgi:hypothetical protein
VRVSVAAVQPPRLLEREDVLAALERALSGAEPGRGGLVLLSAEAGGGKSALVEELARRVIDRAHVLTGWCDPLSSPRPLAPLLDVAVTVGGELEATVAAGPPAHEVAAMLLRELESRERTLLVLEDLHWADEATLDVLRIVARRVESTSVLVVATYRSDALARDHPLRIALGDIVRTTRVERLELPPLSRVAVAELAHTHDADPELLYRLTSGNPFFVTEAIAADTDVLPASVSDAVLARAARVGPEARRLLDTVAVDPQETELWLLERLTGAVDGPLDECVAAGLLAPSASGAFAFRHELARIAVHDALPPGRRISLHREAVAALASAPDGRPTLFGVPFDSNDGSRYGLPPFWALHAWIWKPNPTDPTGIFAPWNPRVSC